MTGFGHHLEIKVISLRNRIIQAYDAVDDILIWEVVQRHLPVLKQDVFHLLNMP
ncbi:HepT-like ribonuclease domain-containing protein [Larkinella rosea]|uniref:DUF86 domain-containing protein n=1 Tax=Larkinella rosea TaxID=2025312 RepID=A0A3P1C3Y1_9BACT|nr:DUF86 domain-containing protein [Larkinella rosea]